MRIRALLATLALAAVACGKTETPAPEPKTDEEKTVYAIGVALSRNISTFNLTPAELELVKAGLGDALQNKAKVELDQWGSKIQELSRTRLAAGAAEEKKKSTAFIEKAAAEQGATKTASGLVYQELTPGTGESPKTTDRVKVHYHGTLMDGTVFDSSVQRGQPATFALGGVIPCWTEGLQLMKVGGKSKLVCPSEIAYGDRGSPPKIKPGSTLVFEVELLEIVK